MNPSLIKFLKLTFVFLFIITSYKCKTIDIPNKKGNLNEAIINSIQNFTNNHKSLLKKHNTFYVGYEVYTDYYCIIISGSENKHLYNPNKKPNDNKFPSNFLEINNKLFIWYDNKKDIDENTIQTYLKYSLLVDNKNETIYFLDDIMDDSIIGVSYYICKNDITNFKKIKSNYIKKLHPDLNCN
ncbi:MAG: hypothetical protein ACK4RM_06080 [Flavobacterium sp.]